MGKHRTPAPSPNQQFASQPSTAANASPPPVAATSTPAPAAATPTPAAATPTPAPAAQPPSTPAAQPSPAATPTTLPVLDASELSGYERRGNDMPGITAVLQPTFPQLPPMEKK